LHGLSRTRAIMMRMAEKLTDAGYQVINLSYPSTSYPVESLVDIVAKEICALCPYDPDRKLHFVVHSMGAIVAHELIKKHRPQNLGRVVALGPPYRGTPIIDRLRNFWLYLKYNGPAALQLGTDGFGIYHHLGNVDYELGIIAGDKWIWFDWFFAKCWLPSPNDGKVPVSSTYINGYKDHIILPAGHVTLPKDPAVIAQTIHFLEQGVFQR
jgi:triacylglycerol lipase